MSLIRKHGAVLQAWACLDLVNPGCHYTTLQLDKQDYQLYHSQQVCLTLL